ncbi:hypothetical protein ABCS02_25855 [Microbacterium sp. X-17]|uniref:hypothetical protein n=1 Tax=Microbacterium sp. X-17 TaxID=3144404 RepID=UPI0031F5A16B
MLRPRPLPGALDGRAFTFSEAVENGVPRSRLRKDDLAHPFRGVYAAAEGRDTLVARCVEALGLLGAPHVFSHVTAARLWGIPVPWPWTPDEEIHVLAAGERGRIRRAGIRSWETGRDDAIPHRIGELLVPPPALVWAQLGGMTSPRLTREWIVAAGDFLVSGVRLEGGRRTEPLAPLESLSGVVGARSGMRGARVLRETLPLIRTDVDSPQETRLRLALVDAGLPEPLIHPAIMTAAGVLHPDLGYPARRVLLEYQGEEHRVDRQRWLHDLTRVQLFQDAGYRVILIGAADLLPRNRSALVARIRRSLR